MITLLLPNNNQAERQYTAEVILSEWLGLSFQIEFGNSSFSAELTLENGKRLLFEDHFFNAFTKPKSYLGHENIPLKISSVSQESNRFLHEQDLPIIFGNDQLDFSTNEIRCGIDIFASTFFMLTRWEEYVLPDRDQHGRFPAKASLASKQGFLQRPIANEYVEMVWKMLLHLGISRPRKKRRFEMMLTHDVDDPLLWKNTKFFFKKLGGDLIKRHSIEEAIFSIKSYVQTRFLRKTDPYNTFDYLMNLADKHGLQSHFFFLCGGNTKYDQALPLQHPFVQKLLKNIQERGHVMGLHPSYNTPTDPTQFKKEKDDLEEATGFHASCGRQHFLRFEAPHTWQVWEDAGMTWDSTLYYPELPGFRCGVCYPYSVFNFLTRQKLRLKEVPLTAMEVSWSTYLKSSPSQMLNDMLQLKESIRKYNGTFVLLWHNSSFNTPEWKEYSFVYEQIIDSNSI